MLSIEALKLQIPLEKLFQSFRVRNSGQIITSNIFSKSSQGNSNVLQSCSQNNLPKALKEMGTLASTVYE